MNAGFKDVMSEKTDEDLIRIVTVEREGYQPLAVEAAMEEIKKRNIDTTKIAQVKVVLTDKMEEQMKFDARKVGSSTRFIHLIIDTIAVTILTVLFAFFPGLCIYPVDPSLIQISGYLLFVTGFFGYYVFMETKYQKTIGKFITGTKVVNTNGTKPRLEDILRRTFCRFIPFDRISFLFTPNGFHDSLSDTTLIKDEN